MDLKTWKNGQLVECELLEFTQGLRRHAGWADAEFRVRSDPAAHLGERLTAAADVIDWKEKLLRGRDDFITKQGLWQVFVDSLPHS